jgi:hypothetical protein
MKKFIPAIGEADFRDLRKANYGFVDKSRFIRDILADSSKVLCFPRPRRFGKTTNLSMLGHFLRKTEEDLTDVFAGLEVTRDPETMKHFQKYPVISVSFKDVKGETYPAAMAAIRQQLVTAYHEHRYLVDDSRLDTDTRAVLSNVLARKVSDDELPFSLKWLSQALYECHKQPVVILIDEYDTPMHAGYRHDYFDKITGFMRSFFSTCLKDNSALFKGVMTGILRVARENMFSDLNHIDVYSIIDDAYATSFGFTEDELREVVETERFDEVRAWYNGYNFGGHVIYNPWSILHYIKRGRLEPYWVNTGGTELIELLALKQGMALSEKSSELLNGGAIDVQVNPYIVLRYIDQDPDAFWNFLFFSGYLKPTDMQLIEGRYHAKLAIPNKEVRLVYQDLFQNWLRERDPRYGYTDKFVQALTSGDAQTAQTMLQRILLTALSFHDTEKPNPEKLYHGLVLGMLVHLEGRYEVRSNRESGLGRADVMMRAKTPGKAGVLMEFKALEPGDDLEKELLEGAQQIREKHYATELLATGASFVYEYTMAFDGKVAWVKRVEDVLKS